MKNSNQKSVSETVCGIDNPEVASENSSTCEAQDVLSQILQEGALKVFDLFLNTFEAKHSAAVECLRRDRDVLLTFYELKSSTTKSPATHTEIVA